MENVYLSNKDLLNKKLRQFHSDGLEKLHVVSDFDKTLTKCYIDGQKMTSSFGIIREGGYLSKEYSDKAFELFNKYYPIEKDESLEYDYRYKKMEEWWKEHEKLLVDSGFSKETVNNILKDHQKIFREGAFEFFDFLSQHQIPIMIFSSGIGNLITGFFEREGRLTENVHIISNIFDFDRDGYATGYKGELIHIMNKSEDKIKAYKQLTNTRENVILLGDSPEDSRMVNNDKRVIRIGFLNEDMQKLELYRNNFDVVITGDSSMNYINQILKSLSST